MDMSIFRGSSLSDSIDSKLLSVMYSAWCSSSS